MNPSKPNYTDFGYSSSMSEELRTLVERQLLEDLKFYGIDKTDLCIDWSDSLIEGHQTHYLGGSVENFSGLAVFDSQDNLVADGWMEFVHEDKFFLAYWKFVSTWKNNEKLKCKNEVGIPDHVWKQIPDDLKPRLEIFKIKKSPWQL